MKHIQKKFLIEVETENFSINPKLNGEKLVRVENKSDQKFLKDNKGSIVFMQTDKNKTISGFVHNVKGKYCLFPVPDPTLVYFHNAQLNYNQSKTELNKLINKLDFEELSNSMPIHELYNYYGATCGIIINLFTAIESFVNQFIPKNFKYSVEKRNVTEIYNQTQIMESIDFKTKLTQILPQITKKDFFNNSSPNSQIIWNLKEFRDQIIHTKPETTNFQYEDLMKKSLNFKYDKAIEATAKLLNYYRPDYVVECGCEKDF